MPTLEFDLTKFQESASKISQEIDSQVAPQALSRSAEQVLQEARKLTPDGLQLIGPKAFELATRLGFFRRTARITRFHSKVTRRRFL